MLTKFAGSLIVLLLLLKQLQGVGAQCCQVAVVIATLQKSGCFKELDICEGGFNLPVPQKEQIGVNNECAKLSR
jgi:hypothetical protein